MPFRVHCTALGAALCLAAGPAAAQPQPQPQPGDASFSVFVRNNEIGHEQVTLSRTESGWIITSSGNTGVPIDFTLTRFEMKYTTDWEPQEMRLDGRVRATPVGIASSFSVTNAISEITQAGRSGTKTDQISARAIVVPNNVYGAYEALAVRLWDTKPNTDLPIYVVPQAEIKATVKAVTDQALAGPHGSVPTRRFDVRLQNPSGALDAIVTVDNRLRLVRFELPTIGVQVVREDASSVAVRTQIARNPTDAEVMIPANGFQLAGTTTTPPSVAGRLRHPAVVLVGGAAPADRDEVINRVPIFTEFARALADAGLMVLRYDRRGSGQSGGRTDAVTLGDYADDAIAAVKWISKQDGVDARRIVVAGYADGGAVALIAASREKRIAGVITLDASGSLGADLLLAQQERVLDDLKLSPTDRQARIALQKKIQAAVVSGKGWEGIPEPLRRQADTPWFRSVLTYDPALVLPKVRQPILIVHGDRDSNVPASEADLLGQVANARKKGGPATVVHVSDVNQTLAGPGASAISEKVVSAVVDWVRKLG
ncbi:MAG TPA: alpha/beta fold hydrolase [Vicinamibacterales bacterium]